MEDVLWTEKYQPQHSSDIIGNAASVRRLHSWLKEWKIRADRDERKKQKETNKLEEGNNGDSDWDCGEEDSKDAEDMLCNTMLITGPTGVGKTAAVYACAQELGFKVFEVNASSQRSGRLILSQLREATQSHQVDNQGVNAHKPTYFNSYGTSGSSTGRPGCSPRKVHSPRRMVSSPRKRPQSPRGVKKGGLAPTSLASFFKMGRATSQEPTASTNFKNPSKNDVDQQKDLTMKCAKATTSKESGEEQSKKMATSLILFEEVDVIFDEDSGFLAAIKTFMTTTKRPVILTTSDPAFSNSFDGYFDEILFKTPSVENVSSYLRLLCLTENIRMDLSEIGALLRLNNCDIRQSLLQLQFWTRSAGGLTVTKPLTCTDNKAELKQVVDVEAAGTSVLITPCDVGFIESRLGLRNIQPDGDIWGQLTGQGLREVLCWDLLMDSRRRGVDLLYSNMEMLLPLPLSKSMVSENKLEKLVCDPQDSSLLDTKDQVSSTLLKPDTPCAWLQETGDCSDDSSPIKMSNRKKRMRKKHCDELHLDSDSEDGFSSLIQSQIAPQTKEPEQQRLVSEPEKRKPLTPEERLKSLPVSQCLSSFAEFFDNMSYLDCLCVHPEGAAEAVVKSGMTDEIRIEMDRESQMRREDFLEIPAAVEALSFFKCSHLVTDAWDKARQLQGEVGEQAAAELTLPVAPHRDGHSFSQEIPCLPQWVEARRGVMEHLRERGVVGGNGSTAALDYLPVFRSICRTEQLKEKGKVKRRFLHYLDSIQMSLDRAMLQNLAEHFP